MNLDKEIALREKEVLRTETLDVTDDQFLRFSGIYSEIIEERDNISHMHSPAKIEFKSLMLLDGKKFVENVYEQILLRRPDEKGLQGFYSALESGQMQKEDVIISVALSKEAIEKKTIITGINIRHIRPEMLLALEGELFIRNAYRWVLGREAGENEVSEKMDLLAAGRDKTTMLYEINQSEEGRKKAVEIPGLEQMMVKKNSQKKLKKLPVFNSIIELLEEERQNEEGRLSLDIQKLKEKIEKQNDVICGLRGELEDTKKQLDNVEKKYYKLCRGIEDIPKYCRRTDSNSEGYRQDELPNRSGSEYGVIDYFDFEDHFRGSRDEIKEAQKIYIPYYSGCRKVLDLGCGRGEFTELLVENGVGVKGVDFYKPYVDFMEERGLPVVLADAVEYLREQENTDGIFLGQVVEHMPIEQIVEICTLAHEKLTLGSYLIMETPNPMSLAIFMSSFYLDPSHQKPVHPYTLRYLVQKAGFTEVKLLFTEGSRPPFTIPALQIDGAEEFNRSMKQIENFLYGSQDYAVIARR